MDDLLTRLKLKVSLTTELNIDKGDFVKILKANVDEGGTGMFSSSFEAFSSSKNDYKGYVGYDGFKIRKRKRLFEMNQGWAVASGTYGQRSEMLVVKTEISGFTGMMIPFYGFLIIFYTIFLISSLTTSNSADNAPGFLFPFIILHALFMFGIPYFIMRRGTSRFKRDLEREFHFLVNKR